MVAGLIPSCTTSDSVKSTSVCNLFSWLTKLSKVSVLVELVESKSVR